MSHPDSAARGGNAPVARQETAAFRITKARELNLQAQARYRSRLADGVHGLERSIRAKKKQLAEAQNRRIKASKHSIACHQRLNAALQALLDLTHAEVPADSSKLTRASPQACRSHNRPCTQPCLSNGMVTASSLGQSINATLGTSSEAGLRNSLSACESGCAGQEKSGTAFVPAPLAVSDFNLGPPCSVTDSMPQPPSPAPLSLPRWTSKLPLSSPEALRIATATVQQISARAHAKKVSVAAAKGVPVGSVRWFLQAPFSVATGAKLSFSTTMLAPSCVTSIYGCYFCLQLEKLFLAAAFDPSAPLLLVKGEVCDGLRSERPYASSAITGNILAALDGMLRTGAPALSSIRTQITCSMGSKHPVSRGIPHIVRGICESYRAHLPQQLWLRVCSAYVQLTGSMYKRLPFAAGVCLHRPPGCGGDHVHRPEQCPRCSVLTCVLDELRRCVTRVTEERAATLHPMPLPELRARSSEAFGTMTILLSQCMVDDPKSMRLVMQAYRSMAPPDAEATMTLQLYSKLKLSAQQEAVAAALWHVWGTTRRAHDAVLTSAAAPLALLPCDADLWPCSMQQCVYEPALPSSVGCEDAYMHRRLAELGMYDQSGSQKCVCAGCSRGLAQKLLGANPGASNAANAALKRLEAFQRRDGDMLAEFTLAVHMPGVVFDVEQLAQMITLRAQYVVPLVDWLWVCRVASEERARARTFAGLAL